MLLDAGAPSLLPGEAQEHIRYAKFLYVYITTWLWYYLFAPFLCRQGTDMLRLPDGQSPGG